MLDGAHHVAGGPLIGIIFLDDDGGDGGFRCVQHLLELLHARDEGHVETTIERIANTATLRGAVDEHDDQFATRVVSLAHGVTCWP